MTFFEVGAGKRRSWGEGAVIEGGDKLKREIERWNQVRDDRLERGETVDMGSVLGVDSGLQSGTHVFDSGNGSVIVTI